MKTDKLFVLSVAFFCSALVCSEACSCMRSHPQEQFCKSDFVILARVKREFTTNEKKIYKVRVRKEFKVSEKGLSALKSGRLTTPSDDAMCGVNLEVGKLYVIAGRIFSLKAYIHLCGMVEEWNKLTKRQRKGLKLMYRLGCTCNIKQCSNAGRRCYRERDSCNWRNECETKEGVCLRHNNKSCMWTRTKNLTHCWKDWRRNITRSDNHNNRNNPYLYP